MALGLPAETAISDLKRALELNPNLAAAHFPLGWIYLERGLLDEALAELNAVLASDPHNLRARHYIARVHLYQQKYDEAFADFEQNPGVKPQQLWEKVLILFYRGEKAAAHQLISELRKKVRPDSDIASTYAVLLTSEGKKEEAEEQIRLAVQVPKTGSGSHFHHAQYNIASAYALMGDRRSAMQWLRRTAENGLTPYPLFEGDPNLNNLRTDPDFAAWLSEMKSLWERRRAGL